MNKPRAYRKTRRVFGQIFYVANRNHSKKDDSMKLALESRELNKQVHQNKYQMPNIEELMDKIGQIVSEQKSGTVYFTNMDLKYAYGQLPLGKDTSRHCKFLFVGGKTIQHGVLRPNHGLSGNPTGNGFYIK